MSGRVLAILAAIVMETIKAPQSRQGFHAPRRRFSDTDSPDHHTDSAQESTGQEGAGQEGTGKEGTQEATGQEGIRKKF